MLRELPIWSLNSVAKHLLEIALEHRRDFDESLRRTRDDRARFAHQLRQSPGVEQVHEGGANFVALRLRDAALAREGLADYFVDRHGIVVKDISDRIADGHRWLRLAVRLPDENSRLIDALGQLAP